jgi:uncharacterized protein
MPLEHLPKHYYMKSLHFFFIFIAFAFCSNAQTDTKIVIGTIDSIQSKILNEKRKFRIYVPTASSESAYGKQRYPIIYSIDGDENYFTMLAGTVRYLSTIYEPVIPEYIVVNIMDTDRTRDCTPTHRAYDPYYATSGGSENFISFIEKELIPYIDAKYPTTTNRTITGGSLAGLLSMQVFLHHNQLFNSYIPSDPSLWWDDDLTVKQAEKVLANTKYKGTSLYIGIANNIPTGWDINTVEKDTSRASGHIRPILKMKKVLEKNKDNGLNFQSKYYNDETHFSINLMTIYDALRFMYKDYNNIAITEKDILDTATNLFDKLKSHYANYKTDIPGSKINDTGYWALYLKQFKKAEELFNYNLDKYPESYKVYVALGDYYAALDDKPNAINNYKKSLAIEEIADIRKKLEKFEGK